MEIGHADLPLLRTQRPGASHRQNQHHRAGTASDVLAHQTGCQHPLVTHDTPYKTSTKPTKPQQMLHGCVSEGQCQWGGASPEWLPEPPCICAFPGTLRRGCARANVKIIPDPLPAIPEQALQLSNVNALKLLRLKSITCCLQCLRQASHPALGSCHLHQLHGILSLSPVEGRACHEGIPESSSPQRPHVCQGLLAQLLKQYGCWHEAATHPTAHIQMTQQEARMTHIAVASATRPSHIAECDTATRAEPNTVPHTEGVPVMAGSLGHTEE